MIPRKCWQCQLKPFSSFFKIFFFFLKSYVTRNRQFLQDQSSAWSAGWNHSAMCYEVLTQGRTEPYPLAEPPLNVSDSRRG